MQLKLRHLQVFNALIEAGSVSRAAERLNLTQPAVSIALGKLEDELGFRLFHRDRGFFAPTNEAAHLHAEVAQGLRAISRIEQRAADILSGATGGISIATNGVLAINILPDVVAGFQRDNPNIHVDIRVHSSRQIASWVSGRQIDIGVIDPPVPVAGLNAEIFEMECVCIIHRDHPLATLDEVTPKDLHGCSVIGITGDHSIDRQLDAMLSEFETPIHRSGNAYFFAIARNLVAASNLVAIIDPLNGGVREMDCVVARPFRPRITCEIAMISAKGHETSRATSELRERIRARINLGQRQDKDAAPAGLEAGTANGT